MAETRFGVNDAFAVQLYSKRLAVEATKNTEIAPLIGDDDNSIIQRKMETSKGSGDSVTFGLSAQMTQRGFSETDTAEGNGEGISVYSSSVLINELGFNTAVRSSNTIDAQRVPFDMREVARARLGDHWGTRISVSFFNQVCGYTPQTDTYYTGLNAVVAPDRTVSPGSVTADEGLASNDIFTLDLIDKAVEAAESPDTAGVMKIRPVNVPGIGKRWVVYLHPYQKTDLFISTSSMQWR